MGEHESGTGIERPRRLRDIWAVLDPAGHTEGRPELEDTERPPELEELSRDDLRRLGWHPAPGEASAWRASGWRFVRTAGRDFAELDDRARTRRLPVLVARVYLSPSGSLLLAGEEILAQAPKGWSRSKVTAKLTTAGLALRRRFPSNHEIVLAAHSMGDDPEEVCARLRDDFGFVEAEPDFRTVPLPSWRPNDPEYEDQWSWRNTGQGTPAGTPGADVSAERAWRMTRGKGAMIAVIDEGFDAAHEDLAAGVHPNSGRFSLGSSGFDFDHSSTSSTSTNWHGTACAGRAGARADNRRQGCGMAPEADLLLIAMNGSISVSLMTRAIEYSVNPQNENGSLHPHDGADVISCSLKPSFITTNLGAYLIRSALRYAGRTHGRRGRGAFIAWSAPNSPGSIDADPIYSSHYVSPVAMTDRNDSVRITLGGVVTQGTGAQLDFVAPGVSIYSTAPGKTQLYANTGCSYATPVVAGLAALCYGVNPHAKRRYVRWWIKKGCAKVGTLPYDGFGRNDRYGFGRIDAGATVEGMQTGLGLGPWP